jgi:cytochrome c oxidase subunit IV
MLNREEGIKVVMYGLRLLALITIAEVIFALLGNGHIIHGLHFPKWVMYPAMIGATLYKAYFIVYEFMHMKYEVKGLAMSVLLPTLLLVWGIIAFFQEGNSWKNRRQLIKDKNRSNIESAKPHGMNIVPATTKVL